MKLLFSILILIPLLAHAGGGGGGGTHGDRKKTSHPLVPRRITEASWTTPRNPQPGEPPCVDGWREVTDLASAPSIEDESVCHVYDSSEGTYACDLVDGRAYYAVRDGGDLLEACSED
jgi:hypothetical protein